LSLHKLFSLEPYVEAQQVTITTYPLLPENIVATSYANLQLISSISGSPLACNWDFDGLTFSFYENSACVPDVSNEEFSSVCEQNVDSFTFTHTIRSSLFSNINFRVNCFFPHPTEDEISIYVQGSKEYF